MPTPLTGLTDKTGVSTHDTDVFGVYAGYKATDKLTLNLRAEYVYWDDLAGLSDATDPDAPFSPRDKFTEVTATIDYALWKNVMSRLEFRWVHDLNGNGGDRFGQGTRKNDYLLALNVIYKF